MSINFTVKHNVEIEAYILEYGDDDIIVLCSDNYEDALSEARGIVAEWA